jgi:type IX secretion system PorP/SprF family membrane protein
MQKYLRTLLLFIILLMASESWSQDPFFAESRQIRSYINPALTGLEGALSVKMIAKSQYLTANPALLTGGISIEQSAPCKKIDFGIHYIYDREGDGMLTSNYLAGNFVYTLPFTIAGQDHNLRLGTKAEWVNKSVRWDRLYFSDQLDPKYGLTDASGNPNPGSFVPPDWDNASQLNLGLGFVHKAILGGRSRKWTLTWGMAVENYTSLFEDKYYDSLLKLEKDRNALVNKYSIHVSSEFPLSRNRRNYYGIKPAYIFQHQLNLTNQQIGFEVNFNKAYTFGMYLNIADYDNFRGDTKSIIFETSMRVLSSRTSQVNIGFQYMHNIGGLSSIVGQTLQVSVRYYLKKDACSETPNQRSDCPQVSQSHKILYENIWYKTGEGEKTGL